MKITRKSLQTKSYKKRGRKINPPKKQQCIICWKIYQPRIKCKSKYCWFECLDKSDNKKYIKNIIENKFIKHK